MSIYPTPLERLQLNPHGLKDGDRVLLPDGTVETIYKTGFKWARFSERPGVALADLRPYSESEAAAPRIQQLNLFP